MLQHRRRCPEETQQASEVIKARGDIQSLETIQVVECGGKEGLDAIPVFEVLVDVKGEVP